MPALIAKHLRADSEAEMAAGLPLFRDTVPEHVSKMYDEAGAVVSVTEPGYSHWTAIAGAEVAFGLPIPGGFYANIWLSELHPRYGEIVAAIAPFEVEVETPSNELGPPFVSPIVIPMVVSSRQAKLALHEMGYLETVEAAIASGPREIQIEWESNPDFRRDNPNIIALARALGIEAELPKLFVLAATL